MEQRGRFLLIHGELRSANFESARPRFAAVRSEGEGLSGTLWRTATLAGTERPSSTMASRHSRLVIASAWSRIKNIGVSMDCRTDTSRGSTVAGPLGAVSARSTAGSIGSTALRVAVR